MPYQYKREPLNNDEVDKLTNSCSTFREKFVIWTFLDTGLRLSEFADLKKENIQWQEKRLVIYGKGGPYGKKTKRRIVPMTDRVRGCMTNKSLPLFYHLLYLFQREFPLPVVNKKRVL